MRALLILFLCASAHAQIEDEPSPSIPDASFRAVAGRPVIVRLRNGAELRGQILSVEAATVSLAMEPTQSIVTLARADVAELRLVPVVPPPLVAPTPSLAVVAAPTAPLKPRHFGLHLGITPGLDLDIDYGLFYGFTNASIVFPAATDGQLAAFTTGAGLNFPVSKNSQWKLELFAYGGPANVGSSDGWYGFVGVGIGMHYTFASGFALGFKVPIMGYSFGGGIRNGGEAVAMYYLGSAMGLPLMSVGYRF